jgi:drug/metabolite transporter (DMT)-like permease
MQLNDTCTSKQGENFMTRKTKAELSLLLMTFIWGVSFPLMSVALKDVGPFTFIAIRNILAALVLVAVFYKRLRLINKKTIRIALLISVAMFIGTALQITGLVYTTPSKSGFLTGLNVVFVPIILAFLYKKLPNLKIVIGVILAIAGLFAMSARGIDPSSGMNFGDFLTILSAIGFSVQIILVDKYGSKVDAILITMLEVGFIGIFSLLPAIFAEKFSIVPNVGVISALIFTSVLCTALALAVMNKMQPETDPTHASIIYLGEPVFSAIASVFIGDRLSGGTLLGCIFILLGMVISSFKPQAGNAVEITE